MPRKPADHPSRIALANELHARPFALLNAPCRISHLSLTCDAEEADRARHHLIALCDRMGAPHPSERAPQLLVDFGRFRLKWEQHTEFFAITVIAGAVPDGASPFDAPALGLLPFDWLEELPGTVLAAIHVHCETNDTPFEKSLPDHLRTLFFPESLIGGRFFDDKARFWGDFRVHEDGFMRFAVSCTPNFEEALLGRIVQRLIEVETYRAASMLALPEARGLWPRLNEIDRALAEATGSIGESEFESERAVLDRITDISAEIEEMTSRTAYRLDASRAYSEIVWRRLEVLSATPLPGLIDLKAFMSRRYDPAMRSCEATRVRLASLSERATRVATLLRTRIDVVLEEQNREVLSAMNKRSAQQLRLQETVEGVSVVAISYYAVGLVSLLLAPLGAMAGLSETWVKAAAVIPILLLVWLFIRRIKARAMRE